MYTKASLQKIVASIALGALVLPNFVLAQESDPTPELTQEESLEILRNLDLGDFINEALDAKIQGLRESREELSEERDAYFESDEIVSVEDVRKLLIVWGDLKGEVDPADVEPANWTGGLTSGADLVVLESKGFEGNDAVTSRLGVVRFRSSIKGDVDGLMVGGRFTEEDKLKLVFDSVDGDITIDISSLLDGPFVKNVGGYAVMVRLVGSGIDMDGERDLLGKLSEGDRAEFDQEKESVENFVKEFGTGDSVMCKKLYDRLMDYRTVKIPSLESLLAEIADNSTEAGCTVLLDRFESVVIPELRREKFAMGLLDFADVDDDQWFNKFVGKVKDLKIVEGFKDTEGNLTGEFGPAANVTVGGLLKMAALVAGQSEQDGEPAVLGARSHWARGFVKVAESLNLSIVRDVNLDMSRSATRGEVLRTVLEFMGVLTVGATSGDVDDCEYSDLPSGHDHRLAICLATSYGVVSGDANATTFRPDAPVTRAEVAKILVNALAAFGDNGSSFDDEDNFYEGGHDFLGEDDGFFPKREDFLDEGDGFMPRTNVLLDEGDGFLEGGLDELNEGDGF